MELKSALRVNFISTYPVICNLHSKLNQNSWGKAQDRTTLKGCMYLPCKVTNRR